MSYIVVRARSNVGVERSIRETMSYLNLTKVNHAVIIPENDQYVGMLRKAKDYITWGKADLATVESMLSERGRMSGDAPLTDAIVAEATDYKTIGDFAKAIVANEATVKDVPGLKRASVCILLEDQKDGAESSDLTSLVAHSVPEATTSRHSLKE